MQKLYTQTAVRRPKTVNEEPSRTDQSFKDDCDVNIVLQRYMKTKDESIFRTGGSYADVSEVPDLLGAHLQLKQAEAAFSQLPAAVRKKLENSPLMLEEYLADPANYEEAVELGLLKARPQDEASKPSDSAVGKSRPKGRDKQPDPQDLEKAQKAIVEDKK